MPASAGVLTVGALTRLIKEALGDAFPAVWVRGEVSSVRRSDRGHLYFTMKDAQALVECAMYSRAAGRLRFELQDGTEVEAFGSIGVYEPRGRYQLIVEELRASGLGALLLALEERKQKLQAEGLFVASRKRPLPRFPRRIGLVTSPVGAAVRDMVKVLRARWPSIGLVLAPVRVQGEGAATEIAEAIDRFNRYGQVDLLIVGRGGGSLEDLWAFNEEVVARAIATSAIPVLTAVGHEVDWTLADLAADARAATPSNAGEIAVRDRAEVVPLVEALRDRCHRSIVRRIAECRRDLDQRTGRYAFRRQREVFLLWQQTVDDLLERLRSLTRATCVTARARLETALARFDPGERGRRILERRARVSAAAALLEAALSRRRESWRRGLAGYEDRLRALSPRRVLERGYCLARRPDGTLLRAAAVLAVGDPIRVEFARGEADARVEAVRAGEEHGQ